MNFVDIIRKKRDGYELTKEEIEYFAFSAADGSVPDYQLSALLMAIIFNGLSDRETLELTDAMARSGDMADLSAVDGITGDKHSTGGVGDKTTLIVAPIVASCGVKIAKMSGRGLGHTGGTVDKLESIPGFRTSLDSDEFILIVNECGICVTGQSGKLCPADKKLYALRDVTATVDNVSLIASSIMSKKLAGGAKCIVLDVKCGSGAFMKDEESATVLAEKMVEIGRGAGRNIAALITDMDVPLGHNIGNSLEIIEAAETLKGNGPDDLTEVSVSLAGKLLQLAGKGDFEECKEIAKSKIADGSAFEKLCEMVSLQGGDAEYIRNTDLFQPASYIYNVIMPQSGFIAHMDAEGIGSVCVSLGAGRLRKEDDIDFSAGIVLHKKTGDYAEKGEVVASLYANRKELFGTAVNQFLSSIKIEDTASDVKPLIIDIVE